MTIYEQACRLYADATRRMMATTEADPPTVPCAVEGCRNELQTDRRHRRNLIDAGWRCREHRDQQNGGA